MPLIYREDPDTRVVELTIRGMLCLQDYSDVAAPLIAFVQRHGPIGVIEIVESFAGFVEHAFEPLLDQDSVNGIARVAMVSDIGWYCPILSAAPSSAGLVVRSFTLDERDTARDWVRPRPVAQA